MKGILRALARLSVVLFLVVESAFDFIWMAAAARGKPAKVARAAWLHRLSKKLIRRVPISVRYIGEFPSSGLIVSNHLSYLDILLFSAVAPCSFVAKNGVRYWPLIGLAAKLSGTTFVKREDLRATYNGNRDIENSLRAGMTVVMFPEGKASDGTSVLPFRSPLLECVVRTGATLTPAAISYAVAEGSVENDICYWGDMTFLPHALKLLTRKGISARVSFGSPIRGYANRKEAARMAHDCVGALRQT